MSIIYLAPHSRTESIDLPSRIGRAALPPNGIPGLHGLSVRKVYHAADVTTDTVSSYLTFSPFPPKGGSLPFCGTFCHRNFRCLPVRKYGALHCPDFPLSI